jgi:NAD(P)H-nitrite reductase large subunit
VEGFDGRIVPLGTEREPPYERPPPSKGCLLGDAAREEARVHDQGFSERHAIELSPGVTVTQLVVGEHRAELSDGNSVAYDRALLATGAAPWAHSRVRSCSERTTRAAAASRHREQPRRRWQSVVYRPRRSTSPRTRTPSMNRTFDDGG